MTKRFEMIIRRTYEQLDEEKCKSSELIDFSRDLTFLKDGTLAADITRDDIEWFNVYAFLLKKVENREIGEDSNIIEYEWNNIGADFEKLKYIMDELETIKVINQVSWSIGGGADFKILDTREFKRSIFRLAIYKLNDLGIQPKKNSATSFLNELKKLTDKTHSFLTKNKPVVILITIVFLVSSFISIANYIDDNTDDTIGIKNESFYSMARPQVLANSSAHTPFADSYNSVEKHTEEVANVARGSTEILFEGNLSISLISTSYEGYPYTYKIFATVGSPGHPNLEIKDKTVGDVIIYNGTDTFEIRITNTEFVIAEFTVRRNNRT